MQGTVNGDEKESEIVIKRFVNTFEAQRTNRMRCNEPVEWDGDEPVCGKEGHEVVDLVGVRSAHKR